MHTGIQHHTPVLWLPVVFGKKFRQAHLVVGFHEEKQDVNTPPGVVCNYAIAVCSLQLHQFGVVCNYANTTKKIFHQRYIADGRLLEKVFGS